MTLGVPLAREDDQQFGLELALDPSSFWHSGAPYCWAKVVVSVCTRSVLNAGRDRHAFDCAAASGVDAPYERFASPAADGRRLADAQHRGSHVAHRGHFFHTRW